mmetsp:Transcript_5973/g.12122  ORF Transcript_5973/g.12122 Transcript_5973/m.12122 type:complete len:205 (+) Transcript_5973:1931-2545(+)
MRKRRRRRPAPCGNALKQHPSSVALRRRRRSHLKRRPVCPRLVCRMSPRRLYPLRSHLLRPQDCGCRGSRRGLMSVVRKMPRLTCPCHRSRMMIVMRSGRGRSSPAPCGSAVKEEPITSVRRRRRSNVLRLKWQLACPRPVRRMRPFRCYPPRPRLFRPQNCRCRRSRRHQVSVVRKVPRPRCTQQSLRRSRRLDSHPAACSRA